MRVEMRLEGGKELERTLESLATDVRERIMREALLAAGEPIRQEAQARAPRSTGRLSADMVVAASDRYGGSARVGPGGDGWYGRFIERGTRDRRTRAGAGRGRLRAQPFLEPAMRAREAVARARFAEVLRQKMGMG